MKLFLEFRLFRFNEIYKIQNEVKKTIYNFDEVLDEIETLDTKYQTSFYTETLKKGLDLETAESLKTELLESKSKYSQGISNSEREFIAIENIIDFRLALIESRISYLTYVNIIKEKEPDCSNPELMYKTLNFYEKAINDTVDTGKHYDKAINSFPASRERLKTDDERPESLGLPLWEYRLEADEYKAIIDMYCPNHGQPIEIDLGNGTIV